MVWPELARASRFCGAGARLGDSSVGRGFTVIVTTPVCGVPPATDA